MASPRDCAASIATARFSLTLFCPMNSARRCGRSFSSNEESSSTGAAETSRSRFGIEIGVVFAVATVPDGRTKCESAQFVHLRRICPWINRAPAHVEVRHGLRPPRTNA